MLPRARRTAYASTRRDAGSSHWASSIATSRRGVALRASSSSASVARARASQSGWSDRALSHAQADLERRALRPGELVAHLRQQPRRAGRTGARARSASRPPSASREDTRTGRSASSIAARQTAVLPMPAPPPIRSAASPSRIPATNVSLACSSAPRPTSSTLYSLASGERILTGERVGRTRASESARCLCRAPSRVHCRSPIDFSCDRAERWERSSAPEGLARTPACRDGPRAVELRSNPGMSGKDAPPVAGKAFALWRAEVVRGDSHPSTLRRSTWRSSRRPDRSQAPALGAYVAVMLYVSALTWRRASHHSERAWIKSHCGTLSRHSGHHTMNGQRFIVAISRMHDFITPPSATGVLRW